MAENKWIVDGHHYTCPDCKKTVAVVINESDEGFEFCPFCGKRMSGQMAENKMAEVAKLFGKKLGEEFKVQREYIINPCYAMFTETGLAITDGNGNLLTGMDIDLMGYTVNTEDLLTARAVIVDD